jgi:type IV secretory pathway component VirB8
VIFSLQNDILIRNPLQSFVAEKEGYAVDIKKNNYSTSSTNSTANSNINNDMDGINSADLSIINTTTNSGNTAININTNNNNNNNNTNNNTIPRNPELRSHHTKQVNVI